jgi:hypothetical protein
VTEERKILSLDTALEPSMNSWVGDPEPLLLAIDGVPSINYLLIDDDGHRLRIQ